MMIMGQDMVIEVMVNKHLPHIVDQWGEVDMEVEGLVVVTVTMTFTITLNR
jgi:hypothetical protein